MISSQDYQQNKAYWDYQRMLEYNRELVRQEAENLAEMYDADVDIVFEQLWNNIEQEDYRTPTVGWQPKNPDYRIDK